MDRGVGAAPSGEFQFEFELELEFPRRSSAHSTMHNNNPRLVLQAGVGAVMGADGQRMIA